ncbi:MAG: extracellular solute-binding protein [bacterium]
MSVRFLSCTVVLATVASLPATPSVAAPAALVHRALGTHLNVALADHRSVQDAFVGLVVRRFGRQLKDGVDLWPQRPTYSLVALALPHSKWDVLELPAAMFDRGTREGLFERLDSPVSTRAEGGGGFGKRAGYVQTGLAVTTSLGNKVPGWAPLTDAKRFPGRRAIMDEAEGTLEAVLLSDGVAPATLYPLDVERALRALNRLGATSILWWKDEREVAKAAVGGGLAVAMVPVAMSFSPDWQRAGLTLTPGVSLIEGRWWVVPKGRQLTSDITSFLTFVGSDRDPVWQRGYGVLSPLLLAGEASTGEASIRVDEAWWRLHRDSVTARWATWRRTGH